MAAKTITTRHNENGMYEHDNIKIKLNTYKMVIICLLKYSFNKKTWNIMLYNDILFQRLSIITEDCLKMSIWYELSAKT